MCVQVALQQAATDPVTGAIDMDLIQTGVSASERVARAQLAQEIKTLLISECAHWAVFCVKGNTPDWFICCSISAAVQALA